MIAFEHDGKQYELELTFRALKAYQKKMGEAAGVAIASLEKIDVVRFGQLFQAALRPHLTEEGVDDLIDGIGLRRAIDIFGQAAAEAFPAAPVPAGDETGPKPQAPSIN